MPIIPDLIDLDATQDFFFVEKYGLDSMWSLQPKVDGSEGTAVYTVMASDIIPVVAGVFSESDFTIYRPIRGTDVPINTPVDSESFRFRYWAIKYVAGTATGTISFWREQKEDR